MKKFLLTLIAMMSICSTAYAANVDVQLNGQIIDFTDENGNKVEAQIVNSRTMVPMRKIFEMLGAEINWDGETKTVLASKDGTNIKLQINNEIAEVQKNGKVESIKLDSKPVLINNRTMVPLRFISESLDKQVGWDAKNQTAIIIDYDYFANELKKKSPFLYDVITSKSNNLTIQITRNYSDLTNSSNNTTSTAFASVSNDTSNTKSILIDFVGNSELFKEIATEGWGTVALNLVYDENGVKYTTSTEILDKMLIKEYETYEELNLQGKYNDNLADAIKAMINIEEASLNISTFDTIKSEYNKFLKLFTYSNIANTSTMKAASINYNNANSEYVDITRFDNIIFENDFSLVYSVINKLIFNYDVKLDELLYDYENITAEITATKNADGTSFKANFVLTNDFNEKITYNVNVNKK